MTTDTPIAVQLYSLRDASAENFDAVLERVAALGFDGVEPFNLYGMTPRAFRARAEALGLRIAGSHYPWANRAEPGEVVEVIGELGLTRAAGGFGPADVADAQALARTVELTNTLVESLAGHGLTLYLHNHWWEFAPLDDGELVHHVLQRECPGVEFELDTYWASNFGAVDVPAELARIAARTPLLHIKDGPLTGPDAAGNIAANVAVGDGAMDIPPVLGAADASTLEWLVVEFDRCDTDLFVALERSLAYLRSVRVVQHIGAERR